MYVWIFFCVWLIFCQIICAWLMNISFCKEYFIICIFLIQIMIKRKTFWKIRINVEFTDWIHKSNKNFCRLVWFYQVRLALYWIKTNKRHENYRRPHCMDSSLLYNNKLHWDIFNQLCSNVSPHLKLIMITGWSQSLKFNFL